MTEIRNDSEELLQGVVNGDPEAIHVLLVRIQREHVAGEVQTLTALAHLDDPAVWQDILGYLAGQGWRGKHMPIARAGITHDLHRLFVQPFGQSLEHRQAVVRAALRHPSARLRALAAALAAELRDPAAVPLALPLLSDRHPEVRIAAAHVIQAVPDPRAIEALLDNMADHDYGVRTSAVAAIRAIGRAALPAFLRRLIDHPGSTDFRAACGHALHWLAIGADPVAVHELAEALQGLAPGVTVQVAADRLFSWCREHTETLEDERLGSAAHVSGTSYQAVGQ